jgi:hypothetical protein
LAPLAIALALGVGACDSTSDGDDDPSKDGTAGGPGGKADNPDEAFFMDLTMAIVPEAPGRMDVARDPEGQWFFRLIGTGGDVFLSSSNYAQKTSGLNAVLSVEENGVLLDRYRVASVSEEECSFELRAANNQTIAWGPVFRNCGEAEARIAATRDLVAGIVQFKATVSNGARFELTRKADNQWYFELQAADRRVLLESQSYTARTGAINGIESVRTNGKLPERYRLNTNGDGTVSISLRAANGQEIAHGGPYPGTEQGQTIVNESVELLVSERVGNPW